MLLLPVRSGIGPYGDGYDVSLDLLNPPSGIISILAWVAITGASAWMAMRSSNWFSFAAFWFTFGHLLESTVLGLELYFEHRNYLPSLGVWLALVGWLMSIKVMPAIRIAVLLVIPGAQIVVLIQSARVWSDKEVASAVWLRDNPASQRAMMLRATVLANRGDQDGIVTLVRDADPRLQAMPDFLAHKLDVYCLSMAEIDVKLVLSRLKEQLKTKAASHHAGLILTNIAGRVQDGTCKGITQEEVYELFEQVSVANIRFSPVLRAFAHQYLRDYWIDHRDLNLAMHHARKRFELYPDIAGVELMVAVLLSAQLYEEALSIVQWAEQYVPSNPYRRTLWADSLKKLKSYVLQVSENSSL